MERIVNKSYDFESAAEWDIAQQVDMSPQERQRVSRLLKEKFYGSDTMDVRACHREK